MASEINYSIIIPHKNIPDLLRRCLNSIPRREDVQIIVVDDNSDPEKVDFEHFPGIGEKCVEVYFTKEGKGAGYARNVGLKYAKGKWLLFADADDFFTDKLGLVFDHYLDSNFDIVYFQILSVDCQTLLPSSRGKFISEMINNAFSTGNNDPLRYQRLEPWAKLIRHELVLKEKITFDETVAANDLMFAVQLAHAANHVGVDIAPVYCLTTRYGSLAYTIQMDVCEAKLYVILRLNAYLFAIHKYKYRANVFHYVWAFHSISYVDLFHYFIVSLRKSKWPFVVYDLLYYVTYLIKNSFIK